MGIDRKEEFDEEEDDDDDGFTKSKSDIRCRMDLIRSVSSRRGLYVCGNNGCERCFASIVIWKMRTGESQNIHIDLWVVL